MGKISNQDWDTIVNQLVSVIQGQEFTLVVLKRGMCLINMCKEVEAYNVGLAWSLWSNVIVTPLLRNFLLLEITYFRCFVACAFLCFFFLTYIPLTANHD
jgi:hypothetical protein